MKSLICCALFLILPGLAAAEPQVILDTDFGVRGKSFEEIIAAKGVRITGSLPKGWGDNSNWKNNVVADYKRISEGGRRFLRVQQTSGDGLQFMHGLPGMEKENAYYRLTFTARSLTGVSLGVRDLGAPYRTLSTFSPATDGRWRDFSYDFRFSPHPQEIGLYVFLAGNGSLDLQKLKLVKLSKQDLIAEIKAKYPEAGSGNLVNVSAFPLGLQSGWSIDREYSDGDQVQVDSDAKIPGPSGCSALRINASVKGIRLYSAPFAVPWSFETHVLGVSVRGDWDGKLIVTGGNGQVCGQRPLKLSGERWQRVELPFQPVLFAPSHALRLEGKGTLWLDGLQVEHAAKATAYAPQKPMEVSLALPASDAASARVQFTDEPAKIRFAVVGKVPGAVLRARLVTIYGDAKLLPPIRVDAASSGTIAYEPFALHNLGPYRLEACVEDASRQRVSPFNEIVFYRLHHPRYWGKDAPNSLFGTHTLSTNRHLTMAKAVGVNWVRLHDAGTEYIGWSFLEPEKGKWQFRDADVQRYRDHHLKILGLLSTSPGWASNLGKPAVGYFDRYLEPLKMDDWANAVRTIVRHHRGLIDSYEIWNEPWGGSFWSFKFDPKHGSNPDDHFVPSDTPSKDYARLQTVAYGAAHEVFSGVTIVGFNTYGAENGTKWTKDVLDFGGMDACDAVSYHHYENGLTGFANDPTEKAYKAAVGPIIEKLGRVPKPVWMSEGAPLSGDLSNGFYRYTLPYENGNDNWRIADRLARYVITRKANGEAHEFLYTMHGHSTFGGGVEWTTLVTAEGFLHPSAAAHSALAWLLEDTVFVQRVTLAEGVYAYLSSGPNRAVAAITSGPTHAAYNLPATAGVQLLDLFGNPLAPGTAIDDHVHYVECDAGLVKLQAALGVK
ncbi:MAG: hypothetical protein ACLQNE_07035 [Thermoguttaceae bacterium]